jgi:geranylgeranyl pyrophosphate synthase
LRRKKKTLPIIYMLDKTSGSRREKLEAYYAGPEPLSETELEFVRECLAWTRAHSYAQGIADDYRQKAFDALDRIGSSNQAQSELKAIAKFLIDRSY